MNDGWASRQPLLRWFVVVALVVVTIAIQRNFGTTPPDFQAWRAADALAHAGENPYDTELLNNELASDATYGPIWQGDDAARYRMHFFNPPMWLVQLRLLGGSALAMSALGASLLFGSVLLLDRHRPTEEFLAHVLAGALLVVSRLGVSTLEFGQTGLLLAGLIAARLVVVRSGRPGSPMSGTPVALMSFKPHLALAALLPQLVRDPRRALSQTWLPAFALLVVTTVVIGLSSFGQWLHAMIDSDALPPFEDMTLRTLLPKWPLPEQLNLVFLALAVVIVAVTCRRWSNADPALLVLWSIALTIVLSGHGFEHDWMWLSLVPVIAGWRPVPTVLITAAVAIIHGFGFTTVQSDVGVVSTPSLVALAATGYLGWASRRSARDSTIQSSPTDHRATAIA